MAAGQWQLLSRLRATWSGYAYRLEEYPMVEPAWFDKTCDSWIYPVTIDEEPVIAGKDAGYLFSAAVF